VRLDVERLEHVADLRAAAVDDHGIEADVLQQNDVQGESALELFVDHGVAAVFDDNGLAVEISDERQSLYDGFGLQLEPLHVPLADGFFFHVAPYGGCPAVAADAVVSGVIRITTPLANSLFWSADCCPTGWGCQYDP